MSADDARYTAMLLRECDTVELFNSRIVPHMRDHEPFKLAAILEAKRRGYRADKQLGVYVEESNGKS
jgi:hypothetical protein